MHMCIHMPAQNIVNCFRIGMTIKSITKWSFCIVKFECMKIHFNVNLKNSIKSLPSSCTFYSFRTKPLQMIIHMLYKMQRIECTT